MEMNYDEGTLHQIEEELGTVIYPGTEIMTDVGSHHFVKSSSKSNRVLVPQPSQNPHDPLNWNRFWKMSAMTISSLTSFSQGLGPLALAPMFPQLMEAFDSDLAAVVQFTGVCILVLGFSNFFWIPIQTSYGRRPVLIFSTLICLVSNIWRAMATSYGSYMGACVLNGFGSGPAETSQPEIIADIMFLHERGAYNTMYFTAYFGALMVGPIIAGPMAEHSGWRSFFWLNVGVLGLVLLLQIFLFPETKWHRVHPDEVAQVESPSELASDGSETEKAVNITKQENENAETGARDPYLHKGTPSKQQFKLWQLDGNNIKTLLISFWIPWKLLTFPIVELAAFVVSWSASCFLTLNLTQSQAFAEPPYNFGSQTIGFFNFAILVGSFIGLATNGLLSDWISMKATRKNRGIREPEMRLPAMIPYVIISIIGNFIVAFGYEYKWDWKIIVFIGYTAAGIQVAALPAITSTYAVDSYKPVAGSIFVAITVNKNLWGYGFSRFITEWVEESGFVKPIMLNMSLAALWCFCAIPFYFYGKRFRGWTAKSSVHKM
ncbi:Major facilitator superfamily domain general substrate transporter [Penicillium concentricum]|uniref:Major facilitator superfamily domain general substrate transporter n=1 Tax=Penicillium concentricum TaxID=293559 RepID=A0A9W9SAB6_9EURO|nr:Major facilitator superfamily domain general substrate transporter [Penicillium concentricum]KAJ5374477.1 Major facilitator superfamily domain general substrate transporter [Penicillium concentricum]